MDSGPECFRAGPPARHVACITLGRPSGPHRSPRISAPANLDTAVPFFTAAALAAAAPSSLRTTVLTGLAALAAVYAGAGTHPAAATVTDVVTVATVALPAVAINRVVRLGDRRLASAREIAEAAQWAVPEPAARIAGFETAARY